MNKYQTTSFNAHKRQVEAQERHLRVMTTGIAICLIGIALAAIF
jgi:hypothetical protein